MRHNEDAAKKAVLETLRRIEAQLLRTPCAFWACEGPDAPADMITCTKCDAIIMLRGVRRDIERI